MRESVPRVSEETFVELELELRSIKNVEARFSDVGLLDKAEAEAEAIDGGREAWLFMISACLIEMVLWGNIYALI